MRSTRSWSRRCRPGSSRSIGLDLPAPARASSPRCRCTTWCRSPPRSERALGAPAGARAVRGAVAAGGGADAQEPLDGGGGRRPPPTARPRARGARCALPHSSASTFARLRKKWRSCSQVKPMPPCTCSDDGSHPPAGVRRVGLRHRGGQRQRLRLGVRGPGRRSRSPSARPRPRAASARSGARPPGRRRSGGRTACARARTPRPSPSPAGPRRSARPPRPAAPRRCRARRRPRAPRRRSARTRAKRRVASIVADRLHARRRSARPRARRRRRSSTITSASSASGTSLASPPRSQPGRAAQLARRDARQPALLLLVGAGRLDHQAGRGVREERHRRQRVAELLHQDHQLDDAEPLAAVLLVDEDARPAELAELLPGVVVVARRPRPARARARA